MNGREPWQADALSVPERELVAAVAAGKRADLNGAIVRAGVVRALATDNIAGHALPPIGLSIYNATIEGSLDLEGCSIDKPLVFLRCRFDAQGEKGGAIQLRDATLKRVGLYECRIEGDIKADRIRVDSAVFLSGSTVNGMVRLRGARLGEALALDKAMLQNPGDIALLADGLRLDGPMLLRTADVTGEVRLAGAHIGGNLLWEEARIANSAVAVTADGLMCDGAWILRRTRIEGTVRMRGMVVKAIDAPNLELMATAEGLNARGADVGGDVMLDGAAIGGGVRFGSARIGGELSACGARITGPKGDWALAASGATIDRGLSLNGALLKGGFSVSGAVIGYGIGATQVEIEGHGRVDQGRAIEADVLQLKGNWIMRSSRITGSVRLAGARIEGQIGFTGSTIKGSGDLAIRADGAHVGGGWFMGRADIVGLVRLPAARLGNEMRLRGTRIAVDYGPALFASGIRIERELVLDGGFTARGGVVVDHAEITGMLDLTDSHITSAAIARGGAAAAQRLGDEVLNERYDGVALSVVDARIDRLVMPGSAETRPIGIVDLSRAHVGSFEDMAAGWPPPANGNEKRRRTADGRDIDHLVLDGFKYDHLENPAGLVPGLEGRSTSRVRLRWLDGQSEQDLVTHFKPQAWVQLAGRLSAQGYHDDAREIAIWRRRRHRRAASASASAKVQGWLLDVFALYGFNPWRTVLWAALFIVLFAGVWSAAAARCGRADCKDEGVMVMSLKSNFSQEDKTAVDNYPAFSPLAYSLDVFMPFVSLGYKDHWRPRLDFAPLVTLPSPLRGEVVISAGQLLYILYVVEMLLGLILVSLAVTGFTGMLKGDEEAR
jgi:hypothetical protein